MVGDILATSLRIPNYVVATKHPVLMLNRLIFRPATSRVYASYPISSTRNLPERRRLVDAFRIALHKEFVVFDPLTIDERVLEVASHGQPDPNGDIEITIDSRWPVGYPAELTALTQPDDSLYPFKIPLAEIREVIQDIDGQIKARDFRLIEQGQSVAAYRPCFLRPGHPASGVFAELQYAGQTIGIPVRMVWNEGEDGPYGGSPFDAVGTKHTTVDEIIRTIKSAEGR